MGSSRYLRLIRTPRCHPLSTLPTLDKVQHAFSLLPPPPPPRSLRTAILNVSLSLSFILDGVEQEYVQNALRVQLTCAAASKRDSKIPTMRSFKLKSPLRRRSATPESPGLRSLVLVEKYHGSQPSSLQSPRTPRLNQHPKQSLDQRPVVTNCLRRSLRRSLSSK